MSHGKKYKPSTHIGFEKAMILSRAWFDLNGMGKFIVNVLMTRLKKREHGTIKGKWIPINNGKLELPYTWFEKKYKDSTRKKQKNIRPKIKRGFDDAIRKGFIRVTEYGGGYKGKSNKYELIDAWRDYKKPGWVEPEIELNTFEEGRQGFLRMHEGKGHKLKEKPQSEPIAMECSTRITKDGIVTIPAGEKKK